jgi:NCAIR mutase (PurE)-related protein
MPYDDLDYAKIDNHRLLRCGFSEVVYCPGKTADQITGIVRKLADRDEPVILTKADPVAFEAARQAAPTAAYHAAARLVIIPGKESKPPGGLVVVVTAGTTDIPIAEEAALTAETIGAKVERVYDAGVAGAHRLFAHAEILGQARAVVAVAGMEGALPSLVGGIVACPVIAVPTSVGYGASFGGVTALLGMLNSCAPGVSVVNIDNGFGAGYIAATINRQTISS